MKLRRSFFLILLECTSGSKTISSRSISFISLNLVPNLKNRIGIFIFFANAISNKTPSAIGTKTHNS